MRAAYWMGVFFMVGLTGVKAELNATEVAVLVGSDTDERDQFGSDVSLSADGKKALISARMKEGGGAAYIFSMEEGVWSQEAKFVAPNSTSNLYFGYNVALSATGTRAFVSEINHNYQGQDSVYVFVHNAGVWSREAVLVAPDESNLNSFGNSISCTSDGSRVLIASGYPSKAYLFKLEDGLWSLEANLAANSTNPDSLRNTMAINGDGTWAFISAFETDEGSVYTFKREAGNWVEQSRLINDNICGGGRFGTMLAFSAEGNRALVKMDWLDSYYWGSAKEHQHEAVFVFRLENGEWLKEAKLLTNDQKNASHVHGFGPISMAITKSGTRVLIGAQNQGPSGGAAYIFELVNKKWSEVAKFTTSDGERGGFGNAVDISADGTRALIGAYARADNGDNSGLVYMWEIDPIHSTGNTWNWACDCDLDGKTTLEECRTACRKARGSWAWTCEAGARGIKARRDSDETWDGMRAACLV
eukprot:CAMPEP_0184541332 /NCGR_PEP_ID=MMETSP0199_2-20130426/1311_1 /TAXON_ID=1112570 /ORGANISM="Thraustochytrium sp., Strain LLF1b" /LENGTH=473 /DNA_ID=CAMNT_0026935047 /DNA_START=69 /DNA_END=1490 /DNA_ORIENTATION=+